MTIFMAETVIIPFMVVKAMTPSMMEMMQAIFMVMKAMILFMPAAEMM